MAKKKSGVNKSQAIRDYVAANPTAKPNEVANALSKEGVSVTPQFVSTVKSMSKRKKGAKKRPGRPGRKPGPRKASDKGVSVESLQQAKKMADSMGGVDEAKKALDVLSKLVD